MAFPLAALATCLTLTGCSDAGTEVQSPRETVLAAAQQAEDAGADDQFAAMEDGEITFDEYDAAYDNVSACFEDAGLGVSTPVVNPVDGVSYLFQTTSNGLSDAKAAAAQADCLERHWTLIGAAYTTVTPAKMDEALLSAVKSCLEEKEFHVSDADQNLHDLSRIDQGRDEARISAMVDCVSDQVFVLYPNLPPVNIIF